MRASACACDRGARMAFETRARAEYFDLLPTLARYRRLPGSAAWTDQHLQAG